MSLDGRTTGVLELEGHGQVTIHFIDSIEHHRSAKLRGISWWVNSRQIGEPSWERLDEEGAYLDGRSEHAKKFSSGLRNRSKQHATINEAIFTSAESFYFKCLEADFRTPTKNILAKPTVNSMLICRMTSIDTSLLRVR